MTIITLPEDLLVGVGSGMGQQRYDLVGASDSTGSQQVRLLAPPRWTMSLIQPAWLSPAEAGRWQALVAKLRGRANVLAAWDKARPQPRGTLRGSLVLSATAAAGATSIAISGGRAGVNLLAGGGFEIDTNADGLADGWTQYSNGTTGTITKSRVAGNGSTYAQRLDATGLGSSASDQLGVRNTVAVTPGVTYSLSADTRDSGGSVRLYVDFYDGSGTLLSGAGSAVFATSGATWARRSMSRVAPASAATMRAYVWLQAATGGPIAASIEVDNYQVEVGTAATAYAGLATLEQGDWLQLGTGIGSHFCMVAEAATANDAGAITVSIEPPTRASIASGSVVAWDKPLVYLRHQGDATSWQYMQSGGVTSGLALDLLETWQA